MLDSDYIDLDAPNPALVPGIDLWRVDKAEKKNSKTSGDPMIELTLSRVTRSSDKIVDRIMLAGNAYDMGREKLRAFVQPGGGRFKMDELLPGLRGVHVYANTEVTSFQGRSKLEVKPRDGLPNAGYMPWVENGPTPPGYVVPSVDSTHF